jgi:adenosylcobinamide-phosphate synthase
VAWLGKIVNFFTNRLKSNNSKIEKLNGTIFLVALTTLICVCSQILSIYIYSFFGIVGIAIYGLIVIKSTVAILTLEKHAKTVILSLEKNDLQSAREYLSMIVSRNTGTLDIQHVMSGTIESIGESIVDGIVSPLFYFSFLGPIGAIGYRIVNTLDSMMGYKDRYYINIGWMSAKADTILNFIPARLSAILMILSAMIIGADWKNSIHILSTDHAKTSSINAGYPMSAMAGALRVKLEKINDYSLGIGLEKLSVDKCRTAVKIMRVTALLFYIMVSLPIVLLLSMIGWWNIVFGF